MAGLPLDDWQFYVVSAACIAAVWLIVRPLLPRGGGSPSCSNCGDVASSRRRRGIAITHEGKQV